MLSGANKSSDPGTDVINLTDARPHFFPDQTKVIKVVMYRMAAFDLIHLSSHMFHLALICVAHLTSLYFSHLSLSIVEQILVQLSICQSYDNTGSAITCRQKEL